jgi:hypothetical protein
VSAGAADEPAFDLPATLPSLVIAKGTAWARIHRATLDALWFGPAQGHPPSGRFDAPDGAYRICYLGRTVEACFAEVFLRNPPVRILGLADLHARHATPIVTRRDLTVVPVLGPALAKLGVTAELTSSGTYDEPRAFARTVWGHTDQPDGIAYLSRHDNSLECLALFDRAAKAVRVAGPGTPLDADRTRLGQLLDRWGLGLDP